MKKINTYITERLKISSELNKKYCPKTKKELQDIIKDLLERDGKNANLNNIYTGDITDMSNLFHEINSSTALRICNINISDWDVSQCEDISSMFDGCKEFNCDLSRWDVSNVRDMYNTFRDCKKFNSDISQWDVSNVTNMGQLFRGCESFNCDLSHWNVKHVYNIYAMFDGCESLKNTPPWYKLLC